MRGPPHVPTSLRLIKSKPVPSHTASMLRQPLTPEFFHKRHAFLAQFHANKLPTCNVQKVKALNKSISCTNKRGASAGPITEIFFPRSAT